MKTLIKKLILVPFLAIAASASAQFHFSGGITGGASTGTVNLTKMDPSFTGTVSGKNIRGWEAGIFTRLGWDPFYIRPTLLYSKRTGDVSYSEPRISEPGTRSFTLEKIEIPVYIGAHLIGPLSVEAAPVYNYVFNITEDYGDLDMQACRQGMGLRAGICLDFNRIFINANYQTANYTCKDVNKAALLERHKFNVGLGLSLF